jgi:hypothetical protein
MMNYQTGFLGIYTGSTRSSKSSSGIKEFIHHQGLGRFKCGIVIPDWSIRPDDPVYLKWNIPYIPISKSHSIEDQIQLLIDYDVIVFDECQFNDHLFEVVISLNNMGKRIYLCGLDGDFRGYPMGDTLDLIPYCDFIDKKRGECVDCISEGRTIINPSIRTIRVDGNQHAPVIEIGGLEVFKPVCREHCGPIPVPTLEERVDHLTGKLMKLINKNPSLRDRIIEKLNAN